MYEMNLLWKTRLSRHSHTEPFLTMIDYLCLAAKWAQIPFSKNPCYASDYSAIGDGLRVLPQQHLENGKLIHTSYIFKYKQLMEKRTSFQNFIIPSFMFVYVI